MVLILTMVLAALFLPQDLSAQKRSKKTTGRVNSNSTKKKNTKTSPASASNSKRRQLNKPKTIQSIKNPLVRSWLKPGTATIVISCTQESINLVVTIYTMDLFTQSMKYEDGQLLAFRPDTANISVASISSGVLQQSDKDERWTTNFANQRDLQLAQVFVKLVKPLEMQFYPKIPQSKLSTIVLVKEKWYQNEVEIIYEAIKVHFGSSIPTNFVSECTSLPYLLN